MGTTPQWAIPYPEGSDRVMDGDNAMQAIAEAVDTILTPHKASPATVVSGADYTLTTTLALITGTVIGPITPNGAERWLVHGYVDMEVSTAGVGILSMSLVMTVGGTPSSLPGSVVWTPPASGVSRQAMERLWVVDVGASGPRTLELRAFKQNASGVAKSIAANTSISVTRLPR